MPTCVALQDNSSEIHAQFTLRIPKRWICSDQDPKYTQGYKRSVDEDACHPAAIDTGC